MRKFRAAIPKQKGQSGMGQVSPDPPSWMIISELKTIQHPPTASPLTRRPPAMVSLRRPVPHPLIAPAVVGFMLLLLLPGCTTPEQGAETAPEGFTALSPAAVAESRHTVSFARQVKPILELKCVPCHSGTTAPWGFRLENRDLAFAKGLSGARIIPGRPDQSILLALAGTHKNVAVMPLVGNRLTETETWILRRWIAEGAKWPQGEAGELKPDNATIRPENATMREEWQKWFEKDAARQ